MEATEITTNDIVLLALNEHGIYAHRPRHLTNNDEYIYTGAIHVFTKKVHPSVGDIAPEYLYKIYCSNATIKIQTRATRRVPQLELSDPQWLDKLLEHHRMTRKISKLETK